MSLQVLGTNRGQVRLPMSTRGIKQLLHGVLRGENDKNCTRTVLLMIDGRIG